MISYYRLWRLLEKWNYQKKDIIRLAGISESTYRKLLAGESVRMDVLERICLALGVDIRGCMQLQKIVTYSIMARGKVFKMLKVLKSFL